MLEFSNETEPRSKHPESTDVWKFYSPAERGIVFTACRMRLLVLLFTYFHYIKLNNHQFLILISILSDYLFTKHRRVQRGPITTLVSISARGSFATQKVVICPSSYCYLISQACGKSFLTLVSGKCFLFTSASFATDLAHHRLVLLYEKK